MIAKYIPTEILCAFFVVLTILVCQVALDPFNRWYTKKHQPDSNEVTGIIFGVLSLIYSLIVAFVIIAVWENYEELNSTIEKEADKLNSILAHSSQLPDNLKKPIRRAVIDYCEKVIKEEWTMGENQTLYKTSSIPTLRLLVFNFHPQSQIQESIFSTLDENLSDLSDLRNERLNHTRSHVPVLIWLILLAGSIVVILFSYLFHTESTWLKKVYISFLSGIIALCLFLVYMLDCPFVGSTQVSNEAYKNIILNS